MSFITVAAATLPSVPLDFGGNRDRILRSIAIAKEKKATLRTGPELEIPGYGCLDHHLEGDTFLHSWVSLPSETLPEILANGLSGGACGYSSRPGVQRYADRRGHGSQTPECSIQLSNIMHIQESLLDSSKDVPCER
jgi:Carbon-nitrogen hydrolase